MRLAACLVPLGLLLGVLPGLASGQSSCCPAPGMPVPSMPTPLPGTAPGTPALPSTAPGMAPGTAPASGTPPISMPPMPPSPTTTPGATPTETAPGTSAPSTPAPSTPGSSAAQSVAGAGSEAGSSAGGSLAPNMFGDLLAAQITGPLTATLPNNQTQTLTRGQAIPSSLAVPGTKFNFDLFLPNGTLLAAGSPLPVGVTGFAGTLPAAASSSSSSGSSGSSSSSSANSGGNHGASGSNASATSGVARPSGSGGAGIVSLLAEGAFKISENESPMPQDRVFGFYSYFNDVNGNYNSANGIERNDVHREVIGFEKTFLDGNASVGVRLPFAQSVGDSAVNHSDIGDLSVVLKYAFILDKESGNVLSGGMVVTVPTGDSFLPVGVADVNPTLFQPYAGGIYNFNKFYALGFTSIVIPTQSRDVTFLANDLGIGYSLYKAEDPDQFITSIAPTIEGHLTTPLNHRGFLVEPVGLPDIFDFTLGTRFGLGRHASLGLGVCVPVTGPRPFDIEAQAQFNWRF